MGRLINVIGKAVDYIQIVLLCSIVAAIGAQIFSRKIFNKPLEFPEELSMFLLIAVVMLGISVVEKENSHIKVEYFYEKMSRAHNPYGDGKTSEKIVKYLLDTVE